MSDAHGVARDQLRAFITRIERLEEEKKTIADDIRDVYGEAKAMGYDTKIMKQVIALRKKDDQERTEEEIIRDMYLAALGMIPDFEAEHEVPAPSRQKNKPAMALQSPRKAAEAVSERTATGQAAGIAFGLSENLPETANEVPAQDGEGTGLGESLSGKSDTARPASVDAQPNGRGSAGQAEESVVTVVGTESGTVANPTASDQPLEGGDDEEVAHPPAAQAETIVLESVSAAPAKTHKYRPHCQDRKLCRSGTVDHCHNCKKLMVERGLT